VVFFILLAVAQPVLAEPVKIMPFGTWTAGLEQNVSYRYELWFQLVEAGFDVDFVGSKRNTGNGFPDLDLYPKYLAGFDRDHLGLRRVVSSQMIELGKSDAAEYQPDIVLVWMGPSDIFVNGAAGVASADAAIRATISGMRSVVPGVTFLLALTHDVPVINQADIVALNDVIANIAMEMDTPGSPLIVVDQITGFNAGNMLIDDQIHLPHHNLAGEAFVAENWFQVLADILPDFESEPEPEPFQINAGHSGAWYNPATPGQGQLIDVEPLSKLLFLSWFTFTDADSADPNEQYWFTAQGNYTDDTAELTVYATLGGQFDDPQEVSTNAVGKATLSFSDCSNGMLDYTVSQWGLQGSFPLQRAIPGTENVCQELAGTTTKALDPNHGWDGAWFDEETPGQGFLIDVHPNAEGDDFIFVAWFTYGDDTASGQRWLTAQGPLQGSLADIVIYETLGGSFDAPTPNESNAVGTMNIDFTDCSNALLSYSITDEALEGMIDIERAIPGTEALCEQLTQ